MDENVKNQLDKRLERKAKKWVKYAMVAGKSYAFFNNGTVDVFHMVSNDYHPGFAPLYDENTSKLAAGIRFWFKRIDNENRLIASLYEVDGITEYVENDDGNMVSENGRIPYIAVKTSNAIEQVTTGRNYGRLPIVECIANDCRESDLVGLREDIDCYEFTKSGLANEIEDLTGFWWAIENAGGMDDPDVAKFIQRMKTVHAAVVDSEGTGGTRVTSHTQEIPYNARDKMLTILKADLYDNANMVDMSQLSAAQKTTQEIQAAYQSQDNYCGDLRDNIIDAIDELLQIAGLPEQNITMEFDKVVNVSETVNAVMAALPLIGEDIAVDILPMLTADQKALIKKQRAADNMPKLENSDDEDDENDDSESDDE